MGIGDLSGSYQRLTTWGDKSDKAGAAERSEPGKIHKAGSGEFKAAIGEIATKTLSALQSAFSKINFSQHVDTLKQLSRTLSEVKTMVLQKIFPKDLLASMSLGRASSSAKVNKIMEELVSGRSNSSSTHWAKGGELALGKGEIPINLMDMDMHPIVADLMGSAEELDGDNSKMQQFNELWESLPKTGSEKSGGTPHLMDQEMQPIDLKEHARSKSDQAVKKMASNIDRDLLASLRKDVEPQTPRTELQERASSLKLLNPDELKTARQESKQRVQLQRAAKSEAKAEAELAPLRQAATGLKLLSPAEMETVKREISERTKQAQKIQFTINSTTQVLDKAAELGLVSKNDAATLIKNLSFAGNIAAKGSSESSKVEQSLDAFTIKAYRGLET